MSQCAKSTQGLPSDYDVYADIPSALSDRNRNETNPHAQQYYYASA